MTDSKAISRNVLWVGLILAASTAVACGGTADTDPTPVATFKITPAAGGARPQATATVAPLATPPAPAGPVVIEVSGADNLFDVESLAAASGTLTIVFDNRDVGVVHNIHVFRGNSARGESVGETELEAGPLEQRLELTLTPGEYFYQCDAHPATMTGTLTAQ
jgi:plastocyanin